jgi:hypothetical protein
MQRQYQQTDVVRLSLSLDRCVYVLRCVCTCKCAPKNQFLAYTLVEVDPSALIFYLARCARVSFSKARFMQWPGIERENFDAFELAVLLSKLPLVFVIKFRSLPQLI